MEAAATILHGRCQSTPTYTLCLSISSRRPFCFQPRLFPPTSLAPSSGSVEIMLPEISIKRDSVRAGIRLNLSSYSPRGRKETFRTEEPGWLGDSTANQRTTRRAARRRAHLPSFTKSSLSLSLSLSLKPFSVCP